MSIISDINQSNKKANEELAQNLDRLIEQNPNLKNNTSQPPNYGGISGGTIINSTVQIGNNNNNSNNQYPQQPAQTNILKKLFTLLMDWILKHLGFSNDKK